ncbi:MAG: outer membrane protein transport protein [Kofleriaceae bacterium]
MKKLCLVFVAGLATTASANGFLLNEFDARAVGRGNASSATDSDPSSIYYNIGGLSIAEGTHVMVGGSLVAPFVSFNQADGNKIDSNTSPQVIPSFFASTRLSKLISVGLGFYTPFGLAMSWPDNSPTNDILHSQTLRTYFFTPSIGFNLGQYVPGLTLGAGVDIVPATVELQQDVFFGTDRGTAHLSGTATGFGGRVGAMFRPAALPAMSIGVMWRSNVKENFTGTGNFDAPAPYRGQLPPDGDISTSITLPQQLTAGVAYKPMPQLEVEANVIWTNWSQFKTLAIQVPSSAGGTMTITTDEEYEDTVSARLGVEYTLPDVGVGLRAGYIYDPTPIRPQYLTVQLPDVDRNVVTVGASKAFGNYDVHLGLLYVLPASRKTADDVDMPVYKGTFDVSAFVASVTLAGRFGS